MKITKMASDHLPVIAEFELQLKTDATTVSATKKLGQTKSVA
jgi:hypothetical protein